MYQLLKPQQSARLYLRINDCRGLPAATETGGVRGGAQVGAKKGVAGVFRSAWCEVG